MASTYENDLRLQEIGTGEQSGTWGTTTNTNLELIGEALSYSATGEAIANASTHTITVADGVADEARCFYLKCTGGGQACTVTLAPNSLSKVWVIENTTSYTLTFSQGSGANVAILAGQVKMIATDGAGSGAAVFDTMQDLAVPDLFVDDDLTLQSDAAVLGFGADKDVTLTHVADTGLLLNAAMKVQFRDAAISISSSADATLDLAADGDINLTAGVDINIPANVGLTFGNDAEKIEGDGTDLTIAGNNINLTAVADVVIPANVGLTFGTGEKIEGDSTDLTITSGAKINLTATSDIVVPADVGITFGTGEKIEGDNTDLTVTSGADINLTATADVNIPSGVGLTFGDDGEKIEGDGTDLTITGNNINLTATADVVIPANVGITFGTGEKIEGDNTDLTITSGAKINLTATSDVVVPANVGITFGTGEKIEGDNTDLTITSGAKINLAATSDVHLANDIGMVFGDAGEKIEGNGTDLTINSSNDLHLTATTDINIPANVGLTFGDDGEKIEGDGTNLAINSSGDVNITATTVDLDGNLEVSGTITLGSGAVISEAELELLDGVTAGTAIASKVVTTDANIDTTGQRNLTITGDFIADGGDAKIRSTSGSTLELTNTTTALGDNAFVGGLAFRNDDTSGTEPHYAGIKARTDGAGGSQMELEFYADRDKYEADTPHLVLDVSGNLDILTDGAVLGFGAGLDVTLTHVHDTGLLLNAASVIQFRDSAINIGSPADGDLDINADDEIELNSTLIDINGAVDMSSTLQVDGAITSSAAMTATQVDIGNGSAGGTSEILFSDNVSARGKIKYNHGSSPEVMTLETTGTVALSIDNSQNVSIPNGDLTITSTDAASTTASPILILARDGASPEDNDVMGQIVFKMDDDAGNMSTFARIETIAADVSNGGEDGTLNFVVADDDTFVTALSLVGGSAGAATFNSTIASGKVAITGGTASSEASHVTFTNTQGAKTYAVGAGQSDVTNNGFVVRNVTDNTFPLIISDAGAATFAGTLGVTGVVTANAGVVVDNFTLDGTTLTLSSGVLSIVNNDIRFKTSGDETMLRAVANGAVELMHDAETKIATASGGVTVTGEMAATTMDLSSNAVIDGTALVTGVLTTTAATVFNGGFAANDGSTITTADNSTQLTLISTDADASKGPNLVFYRNSANPADNDDLSTIDFIGRNDNSQDVTYGQIKTVLLDASDGIEDARLEFYRMKGGVSSPDLQLNSEGVVINEGSGDVDFRVESNSNTHMLFVDAANNGVAIGHNNPQAQLHISTTNAASYIRVQRHESDEALGDGDEIGAVEFWANDSSSFSGASTLRAAIRAEVQNTSLGTRLEFYTGNSSSAVAERMRIIADGKVAIGGGFDPTRELHVRKASSGATATTGTVLVVEDDDNTEISLLGGSSSLLAINFGHSGDADDGMITYNTTSGSEMMGFNVDGGVVAMNLTAGATVFNEGSADMDFRVESNANTHAIFVNANDENIGFGNQINITQNGMYMHIDANNAHMVIANLDDDDDVPLLKLNRQSADGRLIYFLQANSLEGSVSVSGSTVSYNGFAGRHESSGIPTNTAVGTVLSTIDELDTYPATTKNEALEAITHPKAGQARADHAKVKVSDSVGDKRVYGVVNEFDSDEKVYVTSVGISPVKVTGACAGGDLIESNGDGTAKVQSDDIIRSKTIGKVTIGNSSSSVKLVSCVLYCG